MTMLESPRGKGTLSNLGRLVTREWQRKGNFQFQGDTNQMGEYVNTFLRTARNDFFRVVVAPLGGPEVIAEARRSVAGGNWDGNLNRYRPKYAGGIYFDANVSFSRFCSWSRPMDSQLMTMNSEWPPWLMLRYAGLGQIQSPERWLHGGDRISSCSP